MNGWFNNDQYFSLDGKVFAINATGKTVDIGTYDEVIEGLNKIKEGEMDGKRVNIQFRSKENTIGISESSNIKATEIRKEQHQEFRGVRNISANERQVRKIKEHVPKQYQRY